jgi:pyruvate,water dikinase
MKRAAAIVTNRGGRTCHAAIIARELGIPAIVGCGDATTRIINEAPVTESCEAGGTGVVYSGLLAYDIQKIAVNDMPALPLKLCVNLGNPERAFTTQFLPNDGIGLARLEFIISSMIGIHPNALLQFDSLPESLQQKIYKKIAAYASPVEFYIEKLREGISMIAAAFYPKPVIFRFSDFKSNEYANLLGGHLYEPQEENPMLGYRGASRYTDAHFKEAFGLECEAFKRVRDQMNLTNVQLMVPFVRTVNELRQVIASMESVGLKRGENGLKIIMMCEIPANALLASEFLQYVDGFSIGSNDLTQLTMGIDRDSNLVSSLFDERNDAVKILLSQAINECKKQKKYIGICGQGPSDYSDFAIWLMQQGIEAISLSPDTIIDAWLMLAKQYEHQPQQSSVNIC